MKIDEGEIRTFAFQTIRSKELNTLLSSWDYDSDQLKFVNDTQKYLELMNIMFKNNFDGGSDEVYPSHVPSLLNFAEFLNIFDDILFIQQDLVKQEILSSKKNAEVMTKTADIHMRVLQVASYMVRSFTGYSPCDWGKFPLMDKLIAFLDYTFSVEYFIELSQLIMVLFEVSQGKFMHPAVQQQLPLFFSVLDHLHKENYDIQKISASLRNLSEEKLPSLSDHLFQNLFHTELKGIQIHQMLFEEVLRPKDKSFNTPFEIKKKLIDRFQLSTEYELYANGRISKLKLIGAIHLLNLLKQPDIFDELKIHMHIKGYLCREILLRELRKEKQEGDLAEFLEVNIDTKETLRPFNGKLVTDVIESLDRTSSKGNKLNVLIASYTVECLLLIYRGYHKQVFGACSQEIESDVSLSGIIEEFNNKFFKLNERGSFLELDLIKRFLFIYTQSTHNSELMRCSAKFSCIRVIEVTISFLEQRIGDLPENDLLIEVIELLVLLENKFFELEQFTSLEKITEANEFSCILLRCNSLIRTCLQRPEIKDRQELLEVRLKFIEKFIRWHHLQCKGLSDKGYYCYLKDHIQGLFRAKSRYIFMELASILSNERKDLVQKTFSWIKPEQILEHLEKMSPSLKSSEPQAKQSAAVILEILLFLFHTHRICYARCKERLLSKENFKRVLLYSVEISRLNSANFYLIMNCLSSMVDESAEVQKACYEIGFPDVFIQHVGFNENLYDHIATSCSYELYKPPSDIPMLPPLSWQTNLAPINGTINFKAWTEILFPHRIDWQRVLEFISDLVEKANKQINARMKNIRELIANKSRPEIIEKSNRVFTSEFQKYCYIIFQALTNCEALEFNQQELDLKAFLPEFGKMAREALEFFFSISLTLLRFEKDDAELCKERQTVVELTASFMNLRRVKPFVDEFIANFWEKHMIETIRKFEDAKLNAVARVFSKLAKISEISPQFRETHRKDLFHTITVYLTKRKQSGQETDTELVFFDSLEEIEIVIWLMKLLSLVNSCGNSNISGNNSTVRGVEDRVRRQLKNNLKLVEKFVISITRQRISYSQEKPEEMKYNGAFYEIVDRLARCLIYGPYFQKTPRGLLNQNQIDDLTNIFKRLVDSLSKPDSDKDKVIQSIFERTALHIILFGLYSSTRRSNMNPSELTNPDHFKNEQYLRCQVTAGANILLYILSQEKRNNFHEVVITDFLNLLFERRIIAEVLEFFRMPEVFKYNTSFDEYFETLIAILDVQACIQKIDFKKMIQYKNRAFNNLIGDLAIISLQFLKTNVTPLFAKTRHRWIDAHLTEKKLSIPEFVEKVRSILRTRLEQKPLYEFLRNIRMLEGDVDSKEIFCSWFGIFETVYPDLIWKSFIIPELQSLSMIFNDLLTKEPEKLSQIDSKYFVNLGNNNLLEDFLYFVTFISGRFRNICYLENPPENSEFKKLIKNLRLNYIHLLKKVFAVYDQTDAKLKEQTQRTFFADPRLIDSNSEVLFFGR